MWTLSGFSDETSPEFEEQCSLVSSLGLKYLEFRSAWDASFFSLEPHLSQAHALGGFSGPELFTEAWKAFTEILKSENIPYA